jgi:hypothetical protein
MASIRLGYCRGADDEKPMISDLLQSV